MGGEDAVSAAIAMRRALTAVLALGLVAAFARPAAAALCTIDPVPGATLLYPIFELDLDSPATNDTVLTVQNVGGSAVIAHLTMWTDWAVPILDLDIYLAGFDVQTLDMKELLLDGMLPVTGSAVSPHGPLAGPRVAFPGCNNTTTPGDGPVYHNPISSQLLGNLQLALTGNFSPMLGGCAGSNRGNRVARGYVTIDANGRCSLLFPTSATYFSSVTTRRNVLVGDLTILRPAAAHAVSLPAVALEAAPEGQSVPGNRTFYGRYLNGDGSDAREPLPTIFEARYFNGGVFFGGGTDFFVWRETAGGSYGSVQCGTNPAWYPLATQPVSYFNEQEGVSDQNESFPIALDVQSTTSLGLPDQFGHAVLDLQHPGVTPLYGAPKAQAWVGWLAVAPARFAGSVPAASFPVSCTP